MSAAAAKLMRETSATAIASHEKVRSATQRISDYDKGIVSTQAWLAGAQQKHADNAVAVVSGLPEHQDLPDVRAMEKARVEIEVADTVRQQLEVQKKNAELAMLRDDRAAASAKENYLFEVVLQPALRDFHEAFAGVGEAAVRLMAAHRAVYPDDRSLGSYVAMHGPAAELIQSLQGLSWPNTYRYNVRPSWIPRQFPQHMPPGFMEAHSEILALVKEELAA
ncbi:MAG: hypothetical protein PGN16_13710 [Sphingomonas phyllosphaerae]|uniref:hypothetical protein n=1 Tax=Sphingomonas phyllosphaerae TaxID=257003 RepID=UPI002FF66FDE